MKCKDVLTEELLVQELIANLKSLAKLSEEVGYSKQTIIKYCKKYDIYEDVKDARYKARLVNNPDDDLSNRTFGKLTVKHVVSPDAHGKRRWSCKCACGRTKMINASSLKRGLTKSCGYCSIVNFKGYEDVSGSWFRRLKYHAEERGLQFDIIAKDVYELWLRQNKKCALSGVDVFFCRNQDKSIQTASLDRIDNSEGYKEGNIQIIHKRLNRIKSVLDNDELIFWCNLVAKQHKSNKEYDVTKIKWTDGDRK